MCCVCTCMVYIVSFQVAQLIVCVKHFLNHNNKVQYFPMDADGKFAIILGATIKYSSDDSKSAMVTFRMYNILSVVTSYALYASVYRLKMKCAVLLRKEIG